MRKVKIVPTVMHDNLTALLIRKTRASHQCARAEIDALGRSIRHLERAEEVAGFAFGDLRHNAETALRDMETACAVASYVGLIALRKTASDLNASLIPTARRYLKRKLGDIETEKNVAYENAGNARYAANKLHSEARESARRNPLVAFMRGITSQPKGQSRLARDVSNEAQGFESIEKQYREKHQSLVILHQNVQEAIGRLDGK